MSCFTIINVSNHWWAQCYNEYIVGPYSTNYYSTVLQTQHFENYIFIIIIHVTTMPNCIITVLLENFAH